MTSILDTPTELKDDDLTVHRFEPTEERERKLTFGEAEHARLLKEFGFYQPAEVIEARTKQESVPYERLDGYELHVTMAFLPSAYEYRVWGSYNFDTVPVTALKALEAAKPHFDTFELWTPERPNVAERPRRRHIDPMIVGVKNGDVRRNARNEMGVASLNWRYRTHFPRTVSFHPIARWGEAVIPFNQMERRVLRRRGIFQRRECCEKKLIPIVGIHSFCVECGTPHRESHFSNRMVPDVNSVRR